MTSKTPKAARTEDNILLEDPALKAWELIETGFGGAPMSLLRDQLLTRRNNVSTFSTYQFIP